MGLSYMVYAQAPQKLIFSLENPSLKKIFGDVNVTGQINFHWPNLFSLTESFSSRGICFRIYFVGLVESIFTGRILISLALSIFTGRINFHYLCLKESSAQLGQLSFNKALNNFHVLKTKKRKIKLGVIADYSAKSSCIACKNEIHKSSRFLIRSAQKIENIVCTLNSRIKFGHLSEHRLCNSLQFCLFL